MRRPLLLASIALALLAGSRVPAAVPFPAGHLTLGDPAWRHGGQVAALAFAPDGKTLASAGYDSPIRLWNVATGKERRRFTGHDKVVSQLGFSGDGRMLFSAGPQDVRLWEVSSAQLRAKVGDPSVWNNPVAFSPDGKLVASRQNTRNDHRVRLSSLASGQMLHLLEGHNNGVAVMAFSRDGKTLATGSADETLRLWDTASGKQLAKWTGHDKGPTVLAFSPDGKFLASYGFGSVRVWDVAAGKNVATLAVFLLGPGQQLDFSPDGKTLAVAGHGAQLWDWAADKVVRRLQFPEEITAVAFSPDGKTLATGPREGAIRLWDAKTGKEATPDSGGHRRAVTGLTYLPDGKTLTTSSPDGTVRFWDRTARKEVRKIDGLSNRIAGVVFSPDGRSIAAFQGDGQAAVYDTATGKMLWVVPKNGTQAIPASLAFSADSKQLAVGGHDGPIRLFDVSTRKEVKQIPGAKTATLPMQFSSNGKYLAGFINRSPDPTLFFMDLLPKGLTLRITAPQLYVSRMVFSPDTRILATFSENGDSTFRLFETATGQIRLAPTAHLNGVCALAFSPDGRYAVTGGRDKTLVAWDLLVGVELRRFDCPCVVTSLAWSPDGKELAVGGEDTLVRICERGKFIPKGVTFPPLPLTDEAMDNVWVKLGSPAGLESYNAMRALAMYPARALPLLEARLPTAEAGKQIEQWIEELDSDAFATRERASELLAKRLAAAEGPLRKALEGKVSAEKRKRIRALLRQVEPGEKALKLPGSPELRAARAVEVLEHLATPEAKALLRKWAEAKPPTGLTAQAKESLQRLERRGVDLDRKGKTSP